MTVQEIIKLGEMGYTKEDIIALSGVQTQPVQQTQPTISLTAEDLVKLTQGIAVKTAAGSVETPRSANDIILGMLDAYESTTKEDK